MNKKDRIAVVVSILYILWPLFIIAGGVTNDNELGLVFFLVAPLISYWGYRFIKGDISFLESRGGNGT